MGKRDQLTVDPASQIEGTAEERPDDALPGVAVPLSEPPGGWPADEFTGQSGRFVRDPVTGVRRPAPDDDGGTAA